MKCFAISSHLVGQAICDNIDARHKPRSFRITFTETAIRKEFASAPRRN